MNFTKIALDLRLFDGEGGGDGAAGGEAGAEAGAETTAQPSPEEAAKAREEAFEARIKGEDKELFDKRVQSILKQRFKDSKKLETQLEKQQNVLNMIANRYQNVDASDPDAVLKALESDESMWQRYAEENGLTAEQAKRYAKMEQENAMYRQRAEQVRQQQEAQQIYGKWQAEAEAVKQLYGKFNLQTETQNPVTGERFVNLLKNGVDVKTAYEVVHKDELLSGALRTAVQTTQKKVTDDIKARGQRPSENGLEASKGAVTSIDLSKVTNEQLLDIKKKSEEARARGKRLIIDKDGVREI